MKLKKTLIFVLSLIMVACAGLLVACQLKDVDMSGVSFANKTVVYDGTAKTLEITGTLPDGVTVSYEYYKEGTKVVEAKEAGVYTVKAIFTVDTEKFNAIADMTAKLTISYNMQGITLSDKTVSYNGEAQTISIVGSLPAGVTVSYEYTKDGNKVDEAKNAGVYTVKAKFSGATAIDDLTATLTITKATPTVTFGATKYEELGNIKTLDKPFEFSQGEDGLYYEFDGRQYILGIISSNVDVSEDDISYYLGLNTDGTPDEGTVTLTNKLEKVGASLYVAVEVAESENYSAKLIVAKVTMNKKTVEISTYDDLCKVSSDTKDQTRDYRLNVKYVLKNDIDCDGNVWKTPCTIFGATGNPFCSEFDGNGHTISNLLITNASIPAENMNDQNGLHVGFFGYTVDAYIHDVTFDHATANITRDGYDRIDLGGNCLNPIYFGFVVARMENDESNGGESDLERVTVKNSTANLRGYKIHAGIFIGMDHAANEGVKRDKLNAENVEVYAISGKDNTDATYVGGIVGRTNANDIIVYTNCTLKDIKLGYDEVAWYNEWQTSYNNWNDYIPNGSGQNYVGAFIGEARGVKLTFKDCHFLGTWRMCGNNILGYLGWSPKTETDYNTWITTFTNIEITDCTHTTIIGDKSDFTKGIFWGDNPSATPYGWDALCTNGWCNQFEPSVEQPTE